MTNCFNCSDRYTRDIDIYSPRNHLGQSLTAFDTLCSLESLEFYRCYTV